MTDRIINIVGLAAIIAWSSFLGFRSTHNRKRRLLLSAAGGAVIGIIAGILRRIF